MARKKTTSKKTVRRKPKQEPKQEPQVEWKNPCEEWTEKQLSVVDFLGVEVDTMTAHYAIEPSRGKYGEINPAKVPAAFLDEIVVAIKKDAGVEINRSQAYTGWVRTFNQHAMIQKKISSSKAPE